MVIGHGPCSLIQQPSSSTAKLQPVLLYFAGGLSHGASSDLGTRGILRQLVSQGIVYDGELRARCERCGAAPRGVSTRILICLISSTAPPLLAFRIPRIDGTG